jgi:hypothetical protein
VATNFGSYVGVDSYRDPARFFLADDLRAAEALLDRREVGHVLVPVSLPRLTASMCRIAGQPARRFLLPSGAPAPAWRRTLLARLVDDGRPREGEGASLGFLRLVHAATRVDPAFRDPSGRPRPAAFVWEHVPGGRLERQGAPGEVLEVTIDVDYPAAGYALGWRARVEAGADGLARVRVPYATDRPNGDGVVRRARWSCGAAGGPLAVPEQAVLTGAAVTLE